MTQIAAQRYTGTSVKRSEDPRILTGRGRYVGDVKLPGMLHTAFVRSPLAHGRVLAVDVSAAQALPGVVAVLTGADLEEMTIPGQDPLLAMMGGGGPVAEYTLLATDKVRFVGDPVALVVAESRYLAEDGCELVEVDYEDLPPVTSAAAALDPGSPPLFASLGDNIIGPHRRSEFGDVAGTFAGADLVAGFHLDVHRHQNVPMEGRGCVASYDAGSGIMTVYAATQSVHVTRMGVATRLGIQICDQPGRPNAILPTPNRKVSNLVFGGAKFDILFATCGDKVYKRQLVGVTGANAWDTPNKTPRPRL